MERKRGFEAWLCVVSQGRKGGLEMVDMGLEMMDGMGGGWQRDLSRSRSRLEGRDRYLGQNRIE